jgi:hypothetical protein
MSTIKPAGFITPTQLTNTLNKAVLQQQATGQALASDGFGGATSPQDQVWARQQMGKIDQQSTTLESLLDCTRDGMSSKDKSQVNKMLDGYKKDSLELHGLLEKAGNGMPVDQGKVKDLMGKTQGQYNEVKGRLMEECKEQGVKPRELGQAYTNTKQEKQLGMMQKFFSLFGG